MRLSLHKLLASLFPPLVWTVIILVLLCMPGGMLPDEEGFTISNFDKFVHAGLFGGFVFFWCLYLGAKFPGGLIPNNLAFLLFVLSCLFGIAMEFVQKYWIPGRDFDPWDMVADSAGALIGWLIILAARLRRLRTGNQH